MDLATPEAQYESNSPKKCKTDGFVSCDVANSAGSDSDELFSDTDENTEGLQYYSPEIAKAECSAWSISDTSVLHSDQAETPNTAVIPSTPLSLIPFLSKVNEQWTSDLETPQANNTHKDIFGSGTNNIEDIGSAKALSAHKNLGHNTMENECPSLSPVLHNKKARHRPKRRIIKFMQSPEPLQKKQAQNEPENDSTNTCVNRVASIENSISNTKLINESKIIQNEKELCTVVGRKEVPNMTNVLNTSTQNFFNDMSFSNIDQICAENFSTITKNNGTESRGNQTTVGNSLYASKVQKSEDSLNAKGIIEANFGEKIPASATHGINQVPKSILTAGDFATASGKALNVSNSALSKAQVLFEESFNDESPSETMKKVCCDTEMENKKGNELHSLKISEIGKSSLEPSTLLRPMSTNIRGHVRRVLNKNISKKNDTVERASDTINTSTSFKNVTELRFQTAAGRAIRASETASQKVNSIFSEEIQDLKNVPELTENDKSTIAMDKSFVPGNVNIYTVHRRKAPTLQGALARKENLCSKDTNWDSRIGIVKDTNNSLQIEKRKTDQCFNKDFKNAAENVKDTPPEFGFQTAGGRALSISKSALEKVNSMFFEDIENIGEIQDLKQDSASLYHRAADTSPVANPKRDPTNNCNNSTATSSEIGFQTAAGRPVIIKKSALQKASLLLSENNENSDEMSNLKEDSSNNCSKSIGKPSEFGFQTAAGRPVAIKESTLQKAYLLLSENNDNSDDMSNLKDNSSNNCSKTTGKPSEFGFQTAAGRPVAIKESTLQKAYLLLSENNDNSDDMSNLKDNSSNNCSKSTGKPSEFGFQTAAGRPVAIKESTLQKASLLLSENNDNSDEMSNLKDDSSNNCSKSIGKPSEFRFQTAAGRPVVIKESTLQKASLLLSENNDNSDEMSNLKDDSSNNCSKSIGKPSEFGFQTAAGHPVVIKESTLQKASLLLSENNDNSDEMSNLKDDSSNNCIKSTRKPSEFGFQTAAGRPVVIRESTLQKASLLLSEVNESTGEMQTPKNDSINDFGKNIEKSSECGFQTAAGRSIAIQESALQKANLLLSEDIQCTEESPNLRKKTLKEFEKVTDESTGFGFQTANGNPVSISKSAIQKVSSIFSEEVENIEDIQNQLEVSIFKNENHKSIPLSVECQSAAVGPVLKSQSALQKANLLFSEGIRNCDKMQDFQKSRMEYENRSCHPGKFGFETPNDPQMPVSERMLNKDKLYLFKDVLNTNKTRSVPLEKRKAQDSDADEFLRRSLGSYSKKLRTDNGCFARKLSYGSVTDEKKMPNNFEELDQKLKPLSCYKQDSNQQKYDNHISKKRRLSNEMACGDRIAEEIFASTEALLADEGEKKCKDEISQNSKEDKENGTVTPSSPVIGNRNYARRRKNAALKKKNINRLISDRVKLGKEPEEGIKEENVNTVKGRNAEAASNYGDTQLIMNFIDNSANVLERRIETARKQDEMIKLKLRRKPKPSPGRLFSYKQHNRKNILKWSEVSNRKAPMLRSFDELVNIGISPEVLNINAENAIDYKFRCSDFYGHDIAQNNTEGISVGEDTTLILDGNGYAGISEIRRSFLAIPSVDPSLVPSGWVENHYKWIIWKLASIDRRNFVGVDFRRALTPSEVIAQLKYRYDREIDRAQRPAIRKILEKDDVPSKRMVLCVSSIIEHRDSKQNTSQKEGSLIKKLILTDGWYSIPAVVDLAMLMHISSGKVKEGTKLLICGSELLNCEEGCSPLEKPDGVCLKIHTNSTRRARWDTKLGYIAPVHPIRVKLQHVYPTGGSIGKITVMIARVYPILYYEKTATGESIFRNARCEEKARRVYEQEYQAKIEAFYAQAEKQFYNSKKSADTDSIDLAVAEWNEDCDKLTKREFLSKQEQENMIDRFRSKEEEIKRKLQSKLNQNLPKPRQVTPLLKVRIIENNTTGILSIWSPNEEIMDTIKEGSCVSICNITTSGKRANELQLNAGRSTLFIPKSIPKNTCNVGYSERMYTSLHDINPSFAPAYHEFDTVGIVVYTSNAPYGMKNFEAVYITHPIKDSSESSFLAILFWQGVSGHGYAEILTSGSLVACSNLEWRRAVSWNIPIAYCTERTVFTRNPRQRNLSQAFNILKSVKLDMSVYISNCVAYITDEVQKKPAPRTPDCKLNVSNSKKNVLGECNSVFEEFIPGTPPSGYTPKSVEIRKRLDKLEIYGEPSKVPSIVVTNSKRVSLDFQSPIRSKSVASIKLPK